MTRRNALPMNDIHQRRIRDNGLTGTPRPAAASRLSFGSTQAHQTAANGALRSIAACCDYDMAKAL